jgi:hypothetical protein
MSALASLSGRAVACPDRLPRSKTAEVSVAPSVRLYTPGFTASRLSVERALRKRCPPTTCCPVCSRLRAPSRLAEDLAILADPRRCPSLGLGRTGAQRTGHASRRVSGPQIVMVNGGLIFCRGCLSGVCRCITSVLEASWRRYQPSVTIRGPVTLRLALIIYRL